MLRCTILASSLVFICTGCFQGKPATPAASPAAKKTYSRDEFTKLVMGKTGDEVIKRLGRPDTTQENASTPDSPTWFYHDITIDPVSGKTDYAAQLIFDRGKVVNVNY